MLRPAALASAAFVSPHASVSGRASLGRLSSVLHLAVVGPDARLGDRACVQDGARVEEAAEVGADSVVGAHAVLGRGARLGQRCVLGAGAVVDAGCVVPNGVKIPPGARITDKVNTMLFEATSTTEQIKLVEKCIALAQANAPVFAKSKEQVERELEEEDNLSYTSAGVLKASNGHWDTFVNVNPNPIVHRDRPGMIFNTPS